jgi:hypothetical protein
MRLPVEQVKTGLLHEDKEVRSLALRYFGRGSVDDESVTAMVMAAIERFGREEAFGHLWPLAELRQTPESVDWAIRELKANGPPDHAFDDSPELQLLLRADSRLTSRWRDEILSLAIEPAEAAQFKLRWEIESWPIERLWNEIRAICDAGKDKAYADDFRFQDAEWMIDVIGRRGSSFPDWGMTVLGTRIPDDAITGNPDAWMQPLLARLAGRLRYEPAIGALIADLQNDGEISNAASQAALVQIGTDEVVSRILAEWESASENFRLYALDVLAWIRSDAALRGILEVFPRLEEDPVIIHFTALQLIGEIATEANEAVLEYLVERGYDDDVVLLNELAASCKLLGQELPGLGERLAEAIERHPSEGRFFNLAMEAIRREFMRLEDGRFVELDEVEQLPPVESFVVGPIRVTKTAGRNDPCPCGSGEKFKKCCWGVSAAVETEASAPR